VTAEHEGTIDVTLNDIPRKTHVKAIHCHGGGTSAIHAGGTPTKSERQ
jgi:hypothetical protein